MRGRCRAQRIGEDECMYLMATGQESGGKEAVRRVEDSEDCSEGELHNYVDVLKVKITKKYSKGNQ